MAMPYTVARQRELPNAHSAAATSHQLTYHRGFTQTPSLYRHFTQPLNVQSHRLSDQRPPGRPLFRSQSASSAVPMHARNEENLLRRKTPQGTVPGAYDAAPVDWPSMRPTKQILLPHQAQGPAQVPQQSIPRGIEYANEQAINAVGTLQLQGANMGANGAPVFSGGAPLQFTAGQTDVTGENFVPQYMYRQQQPQIPSQTQTPGQPWMSAQPLSIQPIYNPAAPSTPSSDHTAGHLLGNTYNSSNDIRAWPMQNTTWGGQQITPSVVPQAVHSNSLNNTYSYPQDLPFGHIWTHQNHMNQQSHQPPSTPLYVNTQQPIAQNVTHYQIDPTAGQPHNRMVKVPPKEEVVAWAHKTYIDLLAALQAQRQHDAQANGTQTKPGLYPRPPKINGITSPRTSRQAQLLSPTAAGTSSGYAEHGSQLQRADTDFSPAYDTRASAHMQIGSGAYQSAPDMQGSSQSRKPAVDCYSAPPPLHRLSSGVTGSSALVAGQAEQLDGKAVFAAKHLHATTVAMTALNMLESMCSEHGSAWIEGMLLIGCLAFGLGDFNKAVAWYSRVLAVDEGHVEALCNLAIASLSLNKRDDAERYWRHAIRVKPTCYEAIDHLVGLLCGERRGNEAVEIINWVESMLRQPGYAPEMNQAVTSDRTTNVAQYHDYSTGVIPQKNQHIASGFSISPAENGRIVALIHAKGNVLYTLGDNAGAAKAFEEAIVLASGIQSGGISALIQHVLMVLQAAVNATPPNPEAPQGLVLLPPEKALMTAGLVFPNGKLPGLREVTGSSLTAAKSTVSNSLLSLAKIFQDGMSSGGGTVGPWGAGVKEILALYYLSLSLHPSPSTANNVGILLASIQQTATTSPSGVPSSEPSTGISLALRYYSYGLQLDNKHAHLYTNLGSLLKDINQLSQAISMYEQAVHYDPKFDIALANLANAVKEQGRIRDAIKYYRRAVDANPDFAEAVCGLANALNSVCDWKGRGGVVRDGGNRDRWHVDDAGMLRDAKALGAVSSGWMKRVVETVEKQLRQGEAWGKGVLQGDALENFVRSIEYAQGGHWTELQHQQLWQTVESWTRQPYEGAKIVRMVERASQRTVWRWYQDKYVRGVNKGVEAYMRPQLPAGLTTPSTPTVLPFHTFTCPLSAKQVRLISEANGLRISCSTLKSTWLPAHVYPPPAPPAPYLKVGYVSSDFNNHPLAHLMQSVFGLHDKSRVKAYCYATTASDESVHRKQIRSEAPVFHEAHNWSSERLIQQIVDDGIHILINLNGFTRGARNEIFAARPAPIQMSFMGFAGTLGAEWCDYLYADTTAVPPETLRPTRENVTVQDMIKSNADSAQDHWVYAENIIFSRYSFFCCDHRQSAPDSSSPHISWEAETKRRWEMRKQMFPKLSDDTVILGNFNQLYKIEPTTFRTWLRILQAVPNAILWLLRFPDIGEENLLAHARTWATPEVASRIMFTDVAPKQMHISRAQVCDLFLDTPECNAHTTAADVLWSGTPLLTLPRHKHKMCSRIAASILRAAVPQTDAGKAMADSLICENEDIYERRAVELARGVRGRFGELGELGEIRRGLWEMRRKGALFDTRRWVWDLEDAYEEAWRRWERGEGGDIDLKQLKRSYPEDYVSRQMGMREAGVAVRAEVEAGTKREPGVQVRREHEMWLSEMGRPTEKLQYGRRLEGLEWARREVRC